jgi:hypothetical protein
MAALGTERILRIIWCREWVVKKSTEILKELKLKELNSGQRETSNLMGMLAVDVAISNYKKKNYTTTMIYVLLL